MNEIRLPNPGRKAFHLYPHITLCAHSIVDLPSLRERFLNTPAKDLVAIEWQAVGAVKVAFLPFSTREMRPRSECQNRIGVVTWNLVDVCRVSEGKVWFKQLRQLALAFDTTLSPPQRFHFPFRQSSVGRRTGPEPRLAPVQNCQRP